MSKRIELLKEAACLQTRGISRPKTSRSLQSSAAGRSKSGTLTYDNAMKGLLSRIAGKIRLITNELPTRNSDFSERIVRGVSRGIGGEVKRLSKRGKFDSVVGFIWVEISVRCV